MDCKICRGKKAEFEVTNSENNNQAEVCVNCLVAVARWSQGLEEWDDSRGVLPFSDKADVGYAAPIESFFIDL